MFRIRIIWYFLVATTPAFVLAEPPKLSPRDVEILTESLRHFDLLKEFYSNYSCDGELVYEAIDPNTMKLKRFNPTRGALAIRDDKMYRLSGPWHGVECLLIATPERFHLFEKSASTGKMFVRSHGKGYQPQGVPEEWLFRHGGWSPGYIPMVLGNLDPTRNARILSVVVSQEGGEDLVTVESSGAQGQLVEHGHDTYYRDLHWALKDCFTWKAIAETNSYSVSRVHIEYQGQAGGFPIIKRLVSENGHAPYGTAAVDHEQVYDAGEVVLAERRTLTVDHFTPGPPDLSVFDPAPILKEIGGLRIPTISWWRAGFVAVNAILLIWLGIFCLRRSRKQDNLAPTPDAPPPNPAPP